MALAIADIQKLLAFDTPGYRFSLANLQRNSYLPLPAPRSLVVSSRALYSRFDDRISTRPRYVLCDNNLALVAGSEELMIFDRYGQVQIMRDLQRRGIAYLGQEGYAWVTPSGQLSVADINHDLQINRHVIPLCDDTCAIPLWLPYDDGFIAAVQDFGDPVRSEPPPEFALYATTYEKSLWNWIVELDGVVEDIFLTNDRTRAVLRQGSMIQVYQVSDGALINEFDTEIEKIHAVVLSTDDELLMLAHALEGDTSKPMLLALKLNGTTAWNFELADDEMQGFLAAGESGFTLISSGNKLHAIAGGEELYLRELENPIGHRLTILRENQILAVAGQALELFSPEGNNRTVCDLRDYEDNLLTAPAVAAEGRVVLGTDRSLIQMV